MSSSSRQDDQASKEKKLSSVRDDGSDSGGDVCTKTIFSEALKAFFMGLSADTEHAFRTAVIAAARVAIMGVECYNNRRNMMLAVKNFVKRIFTVRKNARLSLSRKLNRSE